MELSHDRVWAAIDALACRKGLSPSGLARRAGLDPTTFNPSKRVAGDGRPRWPSTESLAKVLEATGSPLTEFVSLMAKPEPMPAPAHVGARTVPFAGLTKMEGGLFFDSNGFPVGSKWDEIPFPDAAETAIYALEITGDIAEPIYQDGDIIVVSPGTSLRRGDKVVVRTCDGSLLVRRLNRKTARTIELDALGPEPQTQTLEVHEVQWLARIIWASQ